VFTTVNVQATEEVVEVVGHQVFESDEYRGDADLDEARDAHAGGHLDPVQVPVFRVGNTGFHQQVEGQIRDKRKGVDLDRAGDCRRRFYSWLRTGGIPRRCDGQGEPVGR
jgi:hypothetical protein